MIGVAGGYAKKKGSKIDTKKHCILQGVHPSPLSAHRGYFGKRIRIRDGRDAYCLLGNTTCMVRGGKVHAIPSYRLSAKHPAHVLLL